MSSKTAVSSANSLDMVTGLSGVKAALSSETGVRKASPALVILPAFPTPTRPSCTTQIRGGKTSLGALRCRGTAEHACCLLWVSRNPGALQP